jgi:hypothetical protein
MENKSTNVEELFQKITDYADTRVDLFKLKTINRISGYISSAITIVILATLFIILLFCITVGLALVIGEWIGEVYYGFFIVSGIYLIIGLVFYSMRKKLLKTPISNKLIREIID